MLVESYSVSVLWQNNHNNWVQLQSLKLSCTAAQGIQSAEERREHLRVWFSVRFMWSPCLTLPAALARTSLSPFSHQPRFHKAWWKDWSTTLLFLLPELLSASSGHWFSLSRSHSNATMAQGKQSDPTEELGNGDRGRKLFLDSRYFLFLSYITTVFGHFSWPQNWSSGSQNMEVYSVCA